MYSEAKSKRKREDIPSMSQMLLSAVGNVWRFSQRSLGRLLRWTWLMIRWTAIKSWQLTALAGVFTWKATIWTLRLPWRMLRGVGRWWLGPQPYFENERERDIYNRIRRQFRRRNRFRLHTFAYLVINSAFWIQWLNLSWSPYRVNFLNYVALSVVTSFFLLFHFLQMRSAVAEENAIEAALSHERHFADYHDNIRYSRLTDDGEIVDEYYLEEEMSKRKRG